MADSKISALTAATTLASTDEFVIATGGASKKVTLATLKPAVSLFDAYALLRDEKTAGTVGGTFTSGAWQTRDLNTEAFDPDGIVSISANQFILQEGTYFIYARAPAFDVDRHKAKLANITDTTDLIIGATSYTLNGNGPHNDAIVQGRITLAAQKTLALQHRCSVTSSATNGFGVEANLGVVEVYTEVMIWRET